MSTAIIPQTAMYEFGDQIIKNGGQVSESSAVQNAGVGSAVHYTLTRMTSTPGTSATTNLMNSLLGNWAVQAQAQQHRRLERTQSAPSQTGAVVASIIGQSSGAAAAAVNTSRYKTELCRPYEEFGVCKYGDKCQFAHGMNELRNLARHPKYKTELCRTYHTAGFCPYGPRCHFVHNQEEATQHNKNVAAILAARSQRHQQRERSVINPAPALSLDSSPSPPCSLSQSPTSSMCSFFSSEPELNSPGIEEQRLPVFNRLSTTPILSISDLLL